jgi:hypothetical protein
VTAPLEDADVETASDGYAARFATAAGQWMLERQMAVTRDVLSDLPAATVIDVGGGHGQVAPHLQRDGHITTVLASAADAVHPSLRPLIEDGAIDLQIGDLRRPPSGERSFDVVLSYRLIAHANDLAGLIAGLTATARTTVVIDYATTRSFNAAAEPLFAAKKKVETNTRPFTVHSDWDIEDLFENHGFARIRRRPQFFWPMAFHRAIEAPGLSKALEASAAIIGLRALFGSPVIARFDRV